MNDNDQLLRFTFANSHVRGEIVRVNASLNEVLNKHDYPTTIQHLLAELVTATSLLSATIKFDGLLVLQARGSGPVTTLMAECSNKQEIRAIARWTGELDDNNDNDLTTLLGKAQLAITIIPSQGQRYQGIVPLEDGQLAHCLESYFRQSEQLETRIWLNTRLTNDDTQVAAGFLLQQLPGKQDVMAANLENHQQENLDDWNRLTHIASTLTGTELLDLDFNTLLHRLFHQDPINILDQSPIQFRCSCSRERTAQALLGMGKEELVALSKKREDITIKCQFCNESYIYDRVDMAHLIEGGHLSNPKGKNNSTN